MKPIKPSNTLYSKLIYEPQELKFGTSGRRGEVFHLSQLEVYINVVADLAFLLSLPASEGGVRRGDEFYFGYDLRPSSSRYVKGHLPRGGIAQAVERALLDAGMKPVNLGQIPTPALAHYALSRGRGSIMVTGSHIPFDRNGYKTNTAVGELLKQHEQAIFQMVWEVRKRVYDQSFPDSPFDESGCFKNGCQEMGTVNPDGLRAYTRRYLEFFHLNALRGLRLMVYQHSAVGRDWLVEILRALGANVLAVGRSDHFIPIDTENMDEPLMATIQKLHDHAAVKHGPFDAIVSTDGDSDRPLILGIESGTVRFLGGDLVGMLTAEYLGADAVVVPISCNDAIDRGALASIVEPKCRIGSPHVIAGMRQAMAKGKQQVCGFEANGGFLTASDWVRPGRTLRALPTRDAALPIIAVLCAAKEQEQSLPEMFARLPERFSRSALIKQFPRELGLSIVRQYSPKHPGVVEAAFDLGRVRLFDAQGLALDSADADLLPIAQIARDLARFFSPQLGFAPIERINFLDGVRLSFANGDVAHIRPSGNADELRIYAVADTQSRADAITRMAVAEPDGILRRLANPGSFPDAP